MVGRLLFVATWVLIFLLASMRTAHAETKRSNALDGAIERLSRACWKVPFAMYERAIRERSGEALGRELATSLGAQSPAVSVVGGSAAATGLAAWMITSRGSGTSLAIGPRLYGGGGGLGFTLRW